MDNNETNFLSRDYIRNFVRKLTLPKQLKHMLKKINRFIQQKFVRVTLFIFSGFLPDSKTIRIL